MARSSNLDTIEKFRFQITFLDNLQGMLTQGAASIGTVQNDDSLVRGGFSECTAPKVSLTEIRYRENIHGNSSIKVPGLATYDPVILRRGVTSSRHLYNWYKSVNDDASTLNKFMDGLTALGAVPFQDANYRKEVLISCLDRNGNFVKHWLLYNAWPSEYKGANDFNAMSEEKAIEELTLSYEVFLEVTGSSIQEALNKAATEAETAALKAAAAAFISGLSGVFNNF